MSDPELPPLSDAIQELLRRERAKPGLDGSSVERMWDAISADLAVSPTGTGQGGSPGGSLAAPGVARGSLHSLGSKLIGGALSKIWPWLALGIGIGGAGGFVAGERAARQALNAVADQPQLVTLPPAAKPPESFGVSPTPTLPLAPVHPPVGPDRRIAPNGTSDTLVQEEALLRLAEASLHAGDWAAALRQTDAYARLFPRGQLAEENAYLGIRACRSGGDPTSAAARLEEFRKRFPRSPLGRSGGEE